jgi:hypothetical protein
MAALIGASLFFIGCETEVAGPTVEVPMSIVPDNAVRVDNEGVLRSLLDSSITEPIAYEGAAPVTSLLIPTGKTVYLMGGDITLAADLAVDSNATLVLASGKLTTAASYKLLVKGLVKVGPYAGIVTGATAAEVSGYTLSGGVPTSDNATVIGNTARVQVLASGSLTLHDDDLVTAPATGKFTLNEAWAAAGAGHLVIADPTSKFSVSDFTALASATRGIGAITAKTDALPNVIPKMAQIVATGAITNVGSTSHALTVYGSLTLSDGGATLGDGTAVTVGVGGTFSAVNATWDAAGVAVSVGEGGSATLGTATLLDSEVKAGGTLTINAGGTLTLDTEATLALGSGSLLNGAGKLAAGATTITGGAANGWRAVGPGTITIGEDTITGSNGATALTAIAADNNGKISVTAASGNKTLTVDAANIDIVTGGNVVLTGDDSSGTAILVLKGGTNAATLVIDPTKTVKVTNTGGTGLDIGGSTGIVNPAEIKINNASITASPTTVVIEAAAADVSSNVSLVGKLGAGTTATTTDLYIVSATSASVATTIKTTDGIKGQ